MRILFRLLLHLLPPGLRRRHGSEMMRMYTTVLAEAREQGGLRAEVATAGREVWDLLRTARRFRRAWVAACAAATLALLLAHSVVREPARSDAPVLEVRFEARDPAGSFTMLLRQGKVVRATLEGAPLPPGRIVQRGDSITLVGDGETRGVRLHLDGPSTIRWEARSPASPAVTGGRAE